MEKIKLQRIISQIELGAGVIMILSLPLSEAIKNISFGILFLSFLVQRFIKKELYLNPMAKGLLFYLATALVVSPFAISSYLSLKGAWDIFRFSMVYVILINDFQDKKDWVEWSLILGTDIGVIWGIVFWKLLWHKPRFEILSLGAPNHTATFLSIVFLFVATKIIWDDEFPLWKFNLLFFSAFLLGVGLILDASRGSFVGLGTSLFLLVFLNPNKKIMVILSLLVISIGVSTFFYKDLSHRALNPQSLYSRFQNWKEAFQSFKASPIVGGATQICYADPDNLYISILARMGILGLAGFIVFVVSYIYALAKMHNNYKYIGLALLTFILTNGIFETTLTHEPALAFMIISALM